METYFKASDFWRIWDNQSWTRMPTPGNDILNEIVENHFLPMNSVRSNLGLPLRVTRCFATRRWEMSQGRSGDSQHCFLHHSFGDKRGACDIDFWNPTDGSEENYIKFAEQLASTSYKRICWYPNLTFFHNDYKANVRQYFVYDDESNKWRYVQSKGQWLNKIRDSFK